MCKNVGLCADVRLLEHGTDNEGKWVPIMNVCSANLTMSQFISI